jgi:5-methylcytosine-specific restriction endonuclease McrA
MRTFERDVRFFRRFLKPDLEILAKALHYDLQGEPRKQLRSSLSDLAHERGLTLSDLVAFLPIALLREILRREADWAGRFEFIDLDRLPIDLVRELVIAVFSVNDDDSCRRLAASVKWQRYVKVGPDFSIAMPVAGVTEEEEDCLASTKVTGTRKAVSVSLRYQVLKRDSFRCVACGLSPSSTVGVELQIDHILPVARGGETRIDNLQTLCWSCNAGKGKH